MIKTSSAGSLTLARLVIHIGTHKTGTTYLQKLMRGNKRILGQKGVVVPRLGRATGHHCLAGVWNARFEISSDPATPWREIARRWSRSEKTVFVSSEELSRLFGPSRVSFSEMRDLAAAFEDVKLICVLRNQADFLQSAYLQVARFRSAPNWAKAVRVAIEKRRFDGLTLDYDRLCSRIYDGFNRREVHFVSYDTVADASDGLARAVLRQAGIDGVVGALNRPSRAQSNPSPKAFSSRFPEELGWSLFKPAQHHKRVTLFSPREVDLLSEVFGPSNQNLARRISYLQPDFRVGPMLPHGADIWRFDLKEKLVRDASLKWRGQI